MESMQSAWRVGNLLGIPFYIDFSWIPIAILMTILFKSGLDAQFSDLSQLTTTLGGVALAAGLFGSVLAHELAHSVVAQAQGVRVKSITLFIFGGIASLEREASTARGAFWVASAGPLLNLTLATLLILLVDTEWIQINSLIGYMLYTIASMNFVLGLFNLLPGLPFDGGQMLKAVVWGLTGELRAGIQWATRTGETVGYLLMGLGLLYLLQGGAGIPQGIIFILFGFFVLNTARNYAQYNRLQDALTKMFAREVMTRNYRVLDSRMRLRDFVDQYLLTLDRLTPDPDSTVSSPKSSEVYFAEADGRYKGMVKPEQLRSIERSQWDTLDLSVVLEPMSMLRGVTEEAPIKQVIALMQKTKMRQVLVFTPTGAVAGLIDKGDIVSQLAQRMGITPIPELLQQIRERNEFPPGFQVDEALDPSVIVGQLPDTTEATSEKPES